jgi:cell division protein FtsB
MTTPGPKRPAGPPRQRRIPRVQIPVNFSDLWARQLERSGMWASVLLVLVIAVFVLFEPVQIWFEQQARIGELKAEVTKSKSEVAAMKEDLQRWGDKAFVEAQARQRLLFVYPGDVSYLIVNDVTIDENVTVDASATVTTTDINWVDALVGSYIAAASNEETK